MRLSSSMILAATRLTAVLALASACVYSEPTSVQSLRAMNYVVVSPQGPRDGGDFGPNTPDTKTSGIQEAFDCAKVARKDVYIAGGTMPGPFKNGVVYHIQETLRIPWFQDFKLDGGEYVINYDKTEGDAIVVDSQMSCRFKFGLIVSPSSGAVVRLKPETKGPDGFAVITASTFEFNALVGAGSVFNDGKKAPMGTGLCLDASLGPILYNRVYATEIIACETGVNMSCGPGGNPTSTVANNTFEILFLHLCSTHMQIGDEDASVMANVFKVNMDSGGLENATGARIFGKRNLFTLDVVRMGDGKGIILEPTAEDNHITSMNLSGGYTNNAQRPSNSIVPVHAEGLAVPTPAFPASGAACVNRTPYAIEAWVVSPGKVSEWTLIDNNGVSQVFSGALAVGQTIPLQPGDSVKFNYTEAPTWRWRGK